MANMEIYSGIIRLRGEFDAGKSKDRTIFFGLGATKSKTSLLSFEDVMYSP